MKILDEEPSYGPETIRDTLRRMDYVMARISPERFGERKALQEFIRQMWERKGNERANGYVKIINRWLSFQWLKPLKYFQEFRTQFVIRYCPPEEVDLLMKAAKKT
jgi:hypothetical protein